MFYMVLPLCYVEFVWCRRVEFCYVMRHIAAVFSEDRYGNAASLRCALPCVAALPLSYIILPPGTVRYRYVLHCRLVE
jgi:hypothetical protein